MLNNLNIKANSKTETKTSSENIAIAVVGVIMTSLLALSVAMPVIQGLGL